MADYRYAALDAEGRERRGQIAADTADAARTALMRKQLFATRLEPVSDQGAVVRDNSPTESGRHKLGQRALMLFTRQLATLASVMPLADALRTLARQTEAERPRAILGRVHAGVAEGRRLADALALEPRSFTPLYRAMVAAGEASGTLPDALERVATLLERQAQVRGKLIATLAYPAALLVVAVVVVAALMIFVVPKVVAQFEDIGQELPLLTRIVITLSDALAASWWALILLAVLGGLGFARALRPPPLRLAFDAPLLALPVAGRLLRALDSARLPRPLPAMLASRLPLVEGLALTAPTITNHVMRAATVEAMVAIREGASLSSAMRRTSAFPPLLVAMAAGGEGAGRLDLMLERAADYLEREFDSFTSTALALLEPAVILIMGGMVAAIVLSILLPLLQLNTLAGA
ncbi:type II secretion system protein GspF [Polymorphobacter multimanifer]|uniref:type II secretion system inner membrane protein GspF n=1 Tax=Polymorphobacter multimanifer TaxID=1070431 RepID=UPI001667F095|nr:type II secretion system inner membrane protein GspF [Polymorphobacter multimanifer]GGI91504.1 type II secretion system protein GspF [Polymorphobacter multimanifer]